MNAAGISDSPRRQAEVPACEKCGSKFRVGRDLCLNCLLHSGLGVDTETTRTLEEVLDEVDVRDADWRLGNYQILEEIGRGGMGVIYRARQRHSRRIVALKRVLSYHADSRETLARFRREAEAAASLDHPNILPIYEVSESEDGLPFFSMKFAACGSLLEIASTLRNDPREIVRLMTKITRAVQHAHNQGILHRDLKPGNILLDGRGEPLVSDFGLAKWLDTSTDLTRTLTIFGTPGYIAPEQAAGQAASLTPAADVYSLGAILFDLLAARPPFLGEHALAVIKQAADKPAPKLRSFVPFVDRDLETICARCLEREPSARYQSAHDLAEDLDRYLEGRPIIARPILLPARTWRWSRRNPGLAAACAACLLLAAIATARQLQSRNLESAMRKEILAAHSIAVLPFLNLDTGYADIDTTNRFTTAVRTQLSGMGPTKIVELAPPPKWTGTGNVDEIRLAAQQAGTRTVLAGTVRRTVGRTRVSLHLFRENGSDTIAKWIFDADENSNVTQVLGTTHIPGLIYRSLESPNKPQSDANADPAMQDEIARGYFIAGRALLDRRTVPDVDRAINCFEGAVRAAPRSVAARSYLALAYMGRNFLSANPKYMERAFQVANEALELSPDNASAHRALCALYIATGQLDDALEHGLVALETGDTSERALGQIAFIWKELGHPEEAIQWFGKAKVSERQPADYEALIGDCWTLLTRDDNARQAYDAAANFHPDLPEGWLGLCHLELLAGNFAAARMIFSERAAEYAAFHTAKPLRAQIEFFERNFEAAERLYREIQRDDPHGVGAQQYGAISSTSALARLKLAKGDVSAANQLLNECFAIDKAQLEKSPRNAEVLYRLAADEAIRGHVAAALTYFQASITAGWIDYRSPRFDPRFDRLSGHPEFKRILSELAVHVDVLGREVVDENHKPK